MYYAQTTCTIDSAHWLKLGYDSPCNKEHGHRWEIVIHCASTDLNEGGMVVDFSATKQKVKFLDHKVINRIEPFNTINPTAENLARVLCDWINELCELEMNKPVCYCTEVYETEGNKATYTLEGWKKPV